MQRSLALRRAVLATTAAVAAVVLSRCAGRLRELQIDAWRWSRAWLLIGPLRLTLHFNAQRRVHGCVGCGRVRLPWEVFYASSKCDDYELCELCVPARAAKHEHTLHREVLPLAVDTAPLAVARCTAEAIAAAFQLFGPRPCLGWRPRRSGGHFGEYEWHSYSEVAEAVHDVGAGLELLLPAAGERRFVGVLGAVCVPWLIADYACTLKGIPLVLMHRATSAAQLAHILDESGAAVLVTSVHLLPLVAEAARHVTTVELRHVISYEDDADAYPGVLPVVSVPLSSDQVPITWDSISWEALKARGAAVAPGWRRRIACVAAEAVVKLLPSSGSTGLPKLVAVTEASLRRPPPRQGATASATLMVVYAYEAMRQSHDVLLAGGRIGTFSGSLARLLDDCAALRPTVFAATPTFWNGLHRQFEQEVLHERWRQQQRAACGDGASGGDAAEAELRGVLLSEWHERKLLGNRLHVLISTGAPLRHEVRSSAPRPLSDTFRRSTQCSGVS